MPTPADFASSLTSPTITPVQRLRALERRAGKPLRLASLWVVLAGWLLVPQAAAIAWCIQQVLVEDVAPTRIGAGLGILLATGLLRAGLQWLARQQADAAVETLKHELRGELLRTLAARGPRWIRHRRSGALAELPGTHVDALDGYITGFVPVRAEIVGVPLVLLAAVFWVDAVVGALLLCTLPLIPLFMMLVGWGAEAASHQQLQAMTRMGAHFADRLRALGLIRLYGQGQAELRGVYAAADTLRERSLKVLRIAFLSSTTLEFFASIGVAMVALYLGLTHLGMLDLRATPLPLSASVFCLLLAPECYLPLRRLATHYHDRAGALAAMDELQRALDDAAAPAALQPTVPEAPAIVLARGVQLGHGPRDRAVLRDLSFHLATGEHLALAGPSGCGKSTLLEALAGWLPPRVGELQMPDAARIGYAPQRPHLFAGSIADNLRLARPQASDAELHAAAEAAQVMRFARALPQQLETRIGERGFGLSGGEARRIALARIFLRQPELLLLDEPTAFLDADTEQALLAALAEFARGRTLVMATHSPAAMQMAGQVLWLPQGRVHPHKEAA
ncbi:MAG: thiol reductant ABC exporter subunit CydD [Pseudoxanthomonas sp.]